MTFSELYDALSVQCSRPEYADNIIGHLMDDLGVYDWDATVPADYVASVI